MIAGLVRALARTCYDRARRGEMLPPVRPELLRAAKWRAARYGLEAELVDVVEGRALPARVLIEKLLTQLRPALEENRDWEEVSEIVRATLTRGNGAARQRAAFRRAGSFADLVDLIVAETAI